MCCVAAIAKSMVFLNSSCCKSNDGLPVLVAPVLQRLR